MKYDEVTINQYKSHMFDHRIGMFNISGMGVLLALKWWISSTNTIKWYIMQMQWEVLGH